MESFGFLIGLVTIRVEDLLWLIELRDLGYASR